MRMTNNRTRTLFGAKKTALLVITATLAVALLAGCGAKRMPDTAAEEPAAPAATEQSAAEEVAVATTAPDAAATEMPSPAETNDAAEPEEPEIIAESSNTVSDKEKQQILDDLTGELGKALDTLGSLEEPDDTDVDAGSIE